MKTKFNGILTLLLAFVVQFTFAQSKTISGTVSDESGFLPGVSIIIKGTTTGAETDFDGNYTIVADAGDILQFSFVGMSTIEKTIGSSDTINITMQSDNNVLDEVVVVGYGTTTQKSFTGTIKTVKAKDLEAKSFSNVSQALTGEVAGVTVINTSGQPGSTATIRIRGFGSVNGNRSPLYVVDGVPFNGSINSINPADIKSTSVLKDATATAIYGARGANGVILITTKNGQSSGSNIEVDVKTGFNTALLPRHEVIKSPEQYIALNWEGLYNRGVATNNPDPEGFANVTLFSNGGIDPRYNMWNVANGGDLIDPITRQVRDGVTRRYDPENWADFGFQTSLRTEANVRFSGGSDKTKYFSSFGYLDDIGYIINSNYKRYTTRLNLTHEVKKWLSGSVNLGYAYSENNNNGQSSDSGSIFWFVDNIPSIYPLFLRDTNGDIVPDPIFNGNQYDYGIGRGFGALTNSIADAHFDKSYAKRHELNGNFALNFKFSDNLALETRLGTQFYNDKYNNLNNPFYGSASGQGGSIYKSDTEFFSKNFLQLLRYKNDFGSHNLEVLAAHESNDWELKRFRASKEKAVVPYLDDLNNFVIVSSPPTSYTRNVALESYFGQVNYNYDSKYFLTASVRRDGSSRFVKDKWGTFGSVGASWVVSEEKFMNDKKIDYLKFKVSYGLVGEQAGVGLYPGHNTFDIGNLNDNYSISIRDNGNPDLTWETSKMFQVGTEFSIRDYFDAAIDYYIKNTDNLLFDRRVGPSQGISAITVNDGELQNRGLEFDLTTHFINKNDHTLDFTINGEVLNNEMLSMPLDPATNLPKAIDTGRFPYGMAEGYSIFDYYMREWAGVNPADGVGMWYQNFDDANGNGQLDTGETTIGSLTQYLNENPNATIGQKTTTSYADATQKFVGKSAIPKVRGAFRLNARVKDFNFSTQFIYSYGGYAYDFQYANLMDNPQLGNNNWHVDILDRWQQPGDITDVPRLSDNFDTNVSSTSTRFLIKSDYLGLNNAKIGYNLQSDAIEKAGVSNINIWVSGDNLFFFSKRKGFNPTTSESGSSSTYRYSPLSTFTLGVRVKF